MRSIWKGYVRFSLVTIPIRIYNAAGSQIHQNDGIIGSGDIKIH